MTRPRVFLALKLASGASFALPEESFRHLVQVLRLAAGAELICFDGRGGEYDAVLQDVAKRGARLVVGVFHNVDRESPLHVTLVQGISKGERMDYTIQKAVELGVSAIAPVVTERCNVAVDTSRWEKKQAHWRGVIVSACEQTGRTRVPELHPVRSLTQWLSENHTGTRVMLDPDAPQSLMDVATQAAPLHLVIGPEGGLSESEVALGRAAGCLSARLGPRLLRTETAGPAALAVLQALAGDFRLD